MIVTAASTSTTILPKLHEIEHVRRANIVAGEFDIIAIIEAEESQELLRIVSEQIHTLEGVGHTRSAIVLQ